MYTRGMPKITLPNGITMAQLGPQKNSRPERIVRMWLVRNGIKHALHRRDLPGRPDVFVEDRNLAILVEGEFWHHPKRSGMLRLGKKWRDKLSANVRRDRRNRRKLEELGIRYVRVWCSETRTGVYSAKLERALSPPAASCTAGRSSRKRMAHPSP